MESLIHFTAYTSIRALFIGENEIEKPIVNNWLWELKKSSTVHSWKNSWFAETFLCDRFFFHVLTGIILNKVKNSALQKYYALYLSLTQALLKLNLKRLLITSHLIGISKELQEEMNKGFVEKKFVTKKCFFKPRILSRLKRRALLQLPESVCQVIEKGFPRGSFSWARWSPASLFLSFINDRGRRNGMKNSTVMQFFRYKWLLWQIVTFAGYSNLKKEDVYIM